ncbi:MAG: LysR substrate-binding domain-containing protein [Pseudomonadota bacterium]
MSDGVGGGSATPEADVSLRALERIRFVQLQLVLDIVQHGTVHKAAEARGMSQPALTHALRELENTLGVLLFERSRRGMSLTAYGEQFAQHAQIMVNQMTSAAQHLGARKAGRAGHVTVAMLPAVGPEIMPRVVARLDALDTNISVTMSSGASQLNTSLLLEGKLDMLVGRLPDATIDGLRQIPLLYDGISVVCGPEHAILDHADLELSDLVSERWVMPERQALIMRDVRTSFRRYGLELPTDVLEVSSVQAVRSILRTTDRIGLLSSAVARDEAQFGLLRVLDVHLDTALTPIGITTRSHDELSPAAALVVDLIRDVCRDADDL